MGALEHGHPSPGSHQGRLWAHRHLTVLQAPGFSSLQLREDQQGGLTLHFCVPPGPPSGPPQIPEGFLGVSMSPQGFLVWAEVWVHYLKVTQSCPTLLQRHGLQPSSFLCPWNSAGQSTGVGSHSLLHGIFPTQGLNPGLPDCRRYLRLASCHRAESPSHPHPGTVPWGQWDQYYQPLL